MDNWDTMLELARSRPTGLRELIEKHGATTSHEIAGVLLGVLNQLRREGPMPSDEVNQAIFGLLKTLKCLGNCTLDTGRYAIRTSLGNLREWNTR
jgi:hypothetical protein